MPPLFAELNALVGRDPRTPIELPDALPEPRPLPVDDADLIALAAERSPDLGALSREVAGREEALELAKAEWLPDFGLNFSVMGSLAQTIGGMVVLPTRVEAIQAGVREAQWLVPAEAAREQYARPAALRIDLYVLRNAGRSRFFEGAVVARRAAQAHGAGFLGDRDWARWPPTSRRAWLPRRKPRRRRSDGAREDARGDRVVREGGCRKRSTSQDGDRVVGKPFTPESEDGAELRTLR
jgi:hypothetical protein